MFNTKNYPIMDLGAGITLQNRGLILLVVLKNYRARKGQFSNFIGKYINRSKNQTGFTWSNL